MTELSIISAICEHLKDHGIKSRLEQTSLGGYYTVITRASSTSSILEGRVNLSVHDNLVRCRWFPKTIFPGKGRTEFEFDLADPTSIDQITEFIVGHV